MVQHSVLYYRQPDLLASRFTTPDIYFEGQFLTPKQPTYEQSAPPQPAEEIVIPSIIPVEIERRRRVAEGIGAFVNKLDEAGITTLLIGGTAAWPGPVATISRLIIHAVQTAGTYHRVQQTGFTGKDAVSKTMWWTIMGR